MRHVSICPELSESLKATFDKLDIQVIVTTLMTIAKHGECKCGDLEFADVDVGFKCREVAIPMGTKGIGLLIVYTLEISETELIVLLVKSGAIGNLSIKERNTIREVYKFEMSRLGLTP